MAHLYRLARAVVLLLLAFAAAPSMALEVIVTTPPNNCNAANNPRDYVGDPKVTGAQWVCGFEGRSERDCGWNYTHTYSNWSSGYFGKCTLPVSTYSCAPNATLGTNAHGARTCTCNSGFREFDGQCTDRPACPDGQEEQGGVCVPKDCQPNETRVNGVCVPEPPCPAGETRVNGVCKKNKCPKGVSAGDGWDMTSEATEYACVDQGISFDGPVQYCLVKVVNNMNITIDGKKSYYGSGRYTGAQCAGGTGGGDKPGNPDPNNPDPNNPDPNNPDPDNPPKPDLPGQPKPPDPNNPPPPPPPPVPPDPDDRCPNGTQRYSNGNCYPPTPPPQPPNGDGKCPSGTVKVGTVCVSPTPPGEPIPEKPNTDGSCPDGFHREGKWCVIDPKPPTGGDCPAGTHMVNGQCVWNGGIPPGDPGDPGGGDGDGDGDGDSVFAGTCEAGFACEGDAIFCAISKEQHIRACRLFDNKSAESDLYDKEKGKEGEQTKDLPGTRSESLANRISTVDALGGGQCIQDLNVVVAGQSISLPMSVICPYLQILGNVFVGIALLLAIRIVGRG